MINSNHYNLSVQTFLPCSRKRGLFGHVVSKSRKAWQTMELYRTQISEVHQTPTDHRKSIWAYRECSGHPISKKNWEERWCFGWVIPGTSSLFQMKSFFLLIDIQKCWDYIINWIQSLQIEIIIKLFFLTLLTTKRLSNKSQGKESYLIAYGQLVR
jgi:hypothetical protein